MADRKAFRASILHCLGDPGEKDDPAAMEYFADGLLIVEDGHVAALGDAKQMLGGLAGDIELTEHSGKLIVPGFIDCHVHFPQVDIIASHGEQLLDWLARYAYPAEEAFADAEHAHAVAGFFVDELLRNGTTTALVFPSVHPQSVDAIFKAADKRGMRLLSGKVLMDENCPEALRDDPESAYADSRQLIEKWHGKNRLGYAITPRFAVTSSEAQLKVAGKLAREFPDVHVHTHLAENHDEVELVAKKFPWSRSYLDVYEQLGLVRERSVFAHCLHLDDQDREQLAKLGAAIAFCPTSNLFLGSGLFDLRAARDLCIRTGVGTDVGGGTSLNMFRTLSEAYKVLQLQGQSLPGSRALYLATLGAANALYLDDRIGNFITGKEADFVVLDYSASSITRRRLSHCQDITQKLFALIMLGDDRSIAETYVMGTLMS
ncbi:MAG: guanine deaminase [Gammaproteobacteria bacterium]|nr:MAG: guanine deaminase [Gammaproteobacteria bacterium]